MRKLFVFIFLLFALINRGFTQTGYPIFVTPTLTPPYSLKLSEYSKFGSQRMVVNIAVNDLNISNLPVKLHIKLETVGVTIETPATINTTPIYLDGGAVTILFGDDLTDYFNINNLIFKGYSKETYRKTGQLPEGFYKITVEVLHYQTNRLISNSGTATAWITLGKPPILKLPENNKVMGEFKGMPLTFSWLPCNLGNPVSAGSVQYKFEMWEMRIDGISPYVVASTVPVFYEETTSNTLLSVYPATMLMEPGMKYAWRVTASDVLGNVPFEQDGHSEIRVFSYKSKCDSVTNFKADARGRSGIFGWQPKSNHTSYNVELRNPETGWLSASETFDNKVEFHDLEYGSTYEIRTQAVCDNDPSSLSDFTAWHRIAISDQCTKPDSATCPNCGCDDNIIPKEIENLELNRNLKPGDTLVNRAGTTRFIVKTATQQGDGVYKGIFLFWAELWKVKFVCEYWDLSANTDNVILNMDFKSVYNPQFLLDVDVMTAYLDSLASAITTLTINTTISDTLKVDGSISTVYVNSGDSVYIVTVGENGELTETLLSTDSDDLGHTVITGEDGEEYVVTGNGEVMGVDEFKNTGGNDSKIEEYKEEKESHLSATTVNFAASPTQKYGFDAYTEQKQALQNGYPALGNGYVPSYKSVASFATDKVVPSSFEKGITFRDEMGIPAVTTGGELTLRGRADGTVTSLYAYKAVTDTTEEVAGKLEVMSYDQQVKKLYIVPVNNAQLPDVTALQNVLNTVYAQAVTRWEVVTVDSSISVTFPNGQMTHGGSSAIAVYNADQNAIISKFKEKKNLEGDALYLFFVDNVVGKTGDVAGYMPLQRQVGFIYDNPNLFIIAHELGHGAFNLRHTFSPENFIAKDHTTQNLMDYNGGTELWKHQWEFIRDPQSIWFAWAQDESEGEYKIEDCFITIDSSRSKNQNNSEFIIVGLPTLELNLYKKDYKNLEAMKWEIDSNIVASKTNMFLYTPTNYNKDIELKVVIKENKVLVYKFHFVEPKIIIGGYGAISNSVKTDLYGESNIDIKLNLEKQGNALVNNKYIKCWSWLGVVDSTDLSSFKSVSLPDLKRQYKLTINFDYTSFEYTIENNEAPALDFKLQSSRRSYSGYDDYDYELYDINATYKNDYYTVIIDSIPSKVDFLTEKFNSFYMLDVEIPFISQNKIHYTSNWNNSYGPSVVQFGVASNKSIVDFEFLTPTNGFREVEFFDNRGNLKGKLKIAIENPANFVSKDLIPVLITNGTVSSVIPVNLNSWLNDQSYNQAFVKWNILPTKTIDITVIPSNFSLTTSQSAILSSSNLTLTDANIYFQILMHEYKRKYGAPNGTKVLFISYVNVTNGSNRVNGANFPGTATLGPNREFSILYNNYDPTTVPHELGHSFGLPHVWELNVLNNTNAKGKTNNIMDYSLTRFQFWKRQISIINPGIQ